MFLPKQRKFLPTTAAPLNINLKIFDFTDTDKELRATHKHSGFYFRVVELDLSKVRVQENALYIYYTPTQYGVTVNPAKETHRAAETWSVVEEEFISWLDWIRQEYENESDLPLLVDASIKEGLTHRTQIIETALQHPASLTHLHPTIQDAAGSLFATGHYRQALLDAYIALDNAVRERSQLVGSGTRLMEAAFSQNNPVLKIGNSPDEQQGFLSLFRGAMLAVRNPKAHSLGGTHDQQRALEWLSFASVLMRNLDEAVLQQSSPPTTS